MKNKLLIIKTTPLCFINVCFFYQVEPLNDINIENDFDPQLNQVTIQEKFIICNACKGTDHQRRSSHLWKYNIKNIANNPIIIDAKCVWFLPQKLTV
jgi:hypothetical protein